MAAATALPLEPTRVRVSDDPEAVKKLARRAQELAAKGLRGKEFLRAFGIEDDGPSVTLTTMEDLDTFFASDDGCAPSR